MSSNIEVTSESSKELFKHFDELKKSAPRIAYKYLKMIGLELVVIAQDKLKSDGHIITARLRNSITTWYKRKRNDPYSWNSVAKGSTTAGGKVAKANYQGGTSENSSPIPLDDFEVAAGTNVNYAAKIEKTDSFLGYAVNNIKGNRSDKIIKLAARAIEKENSKGK